jgi:hypothetical protein
VPKVGLEPTRAYTHYALNVARLPIPPLRLVYLRCVPRTIVCSVAYYNMRRVTVKRHIRLNIAAPVGVDLLICRAALT